MAEKRQKSFLEKLESYLYPESVEDIGQIDSAQELAKEGVQEGLKSTLGDGPMPNLMHPPDQPEEGLRDTISPFDFPAEFGSMAVGGVKALAGKLASRQMAKKVAPKTAAPFIAKEASLPVNTANFNQALKPAPDYPDLKLSKEAGDALRIARHERKEIPAINDNMSPWDKPNESVDFLKRGHSDIHPEANLEKGINVQWPRPLEDYPAKINISNKLEYYDPDYDGPLEKALTDRGYVPQQAGNMSYHYSPLEGIVLPESTKVSDLKNLEAELFNNFRNGPAPYLQNKAPLPGWNANRAAFMQSSSKNPSNPNYTFKVSEQHDNTPIPKFPTEVGRDMYFDVDKEKALTLKKAKELAAKNLSITKPEELANKELERLIYGKNLPMDTASRLGRAEKLGFDTSKSYYHGSPAKDEIKNFIPSSQGMQGQGVYMTPDKAKAVEYARYNNSGVANDMGGVTYPIHVRGKLFDYRSADDYKDLLEHYGVKDRKELGEKFGTYPSDETLIRNSGLYTGTSEDGIVNIFDPKNIRSKWATFDPDKSDSSNISSAVAGASSYPLIKKLLTTKEDEEF